MVESNIFRNVIFSDFVLPFLLIFAVVFAILQKSKVLGQDTSQLNAIVAMVIGLIFIGFAYPKEVVTNLVLFLSVAIVVVLVFLMIYGFATGGTSPFEINKPVKWVVGILTVISVIIAVIWATGIELGTAFWIFNQSWSKALWTNVFFVVVVAVAMAVVLWKKS